VGLNCRNLHNKSVNYPDQEVGVVADSDKHGVDGRRRGGRDDCGRFVPWPIAVSMAAFILVRIGLLLIRERSELADPPMGLTMILPIGQSHQPLARAVGEFGSVGNITDFRMQHHIHHESRGRRGWKALPLRFWPRLPRPPAAKPEASTCQRGSVEHKLMLEVPHREVLEVRILYPAFPQHFARKIMHVAENRNQPSASSAVAGWPSLSVSTASEFLAGP
jgi:hypothetical protein